MRLKASTRLLLNQIRKKIISSDSSFHDLYDDIYFSMVITKDMRMRMILQKTPLKVYSNLKRDFLKHKTVKTKDKIRRFEVIITPLSGKYKYDHANHRIKRDFGAKIIKSKKL